VGMITVSDVIALWPTFGTVPHNESQLQLDEGPADGDLPAHVRGACPPKNLWLNAEPLQHADVDEIYRANIDRLVARGSFTPPAHTFPRARYIAPAASPDEADWEQVRSLWTPPAEE
jgi:hypothetical protein